MVESTYTVTGMSCDHCVRSVREEVSKIDGVRDVAVDLSTGQVTINSAEQPGVGDVRSAVQEAGYELSA